MTIRVIAYCKLDILEPHICIISQFWEPRVWASWALVKVSVGLTHFGGLLGRGVGKGSISFSVLSGFERPQVLLGSWLFLSQHLFTKTASLF